MSTQADTVARLTALSTPDWVVDVGALATEATEDCSNDTDHGPGTVHSRHLDGACLDCAERFLRAEFVTGTYVAVDVLRTPAADEETPL